MVGTTAASPRRAPGQVWRQDTDPLRSKSPGPARGARCLVVHPCGHKNQHRVGFAAAPHGRSCADAPVVSRRSQAPPESRRARASAVAPGSSPLRYLTQRNTRIRDAPFEPTPRRVHWRPLGWWAATQRGAVSGATSKAPIGSNGVGINPMAHSARWRLSHDPKPGQGRWAPL